MILVVAALVVVVAVVVVLGGGAALGAGHRRSNGGAGGTGAGLAVLVIGGLAVAVLVGLLGIFGIRATVLMPRGGDGGGAAPQVIAPPSSVPLDPVPAGRSPSVPSRPGSPDEPIDAVREVRLVAFGDEGFPPPPPAIGDLPTRAVVVVEAAGFEPDTTGDITQCTATAGERTRCARSFPVRFDDAGRARVQYLLEADLGFSRCSGDLPCALIVSGPGGRRAVASTSFGAPAPPPGRVTVTPRQRLRDGEQVTVEVSTYPPGTPVAVVQCAAPALAGAERCGPPANALVGPDGRASVALTVHSGPIGLERAPCGRGRTCGVSVLVGGGGPVASAAVPVGFASAPGARYDPRRVGGGLAVAALLLATAAWLVRTTDWREPSEAAAPDLDGVNLDEP